MNAGDHQNVPVGTLHEQDRNGPVTVFRDWDTLLIDRWRLSRREVRSLIGILNDVLPDLTAAREETNEDYPCDSCSCCSFYTCHRGEGSGCPVNSEGDFACPCTCD